MPLIKGDRLIEDPWVPADDEGPLPLEPRVIVGLARWQAGREELLARNAPLGIRLKSDQPPVLIAEDLEHFDLVALEFPKFTDGRAYSYARLLRERYGFTGELRAVGNVLRDQLFFMQRCGFDAFEVADARTLDGWHAAAREITVRYQPAADQRPWVAALRHGGTSDLPGAAAGKRAPVAACAAE
jgi:uncharacterized protein (DUF934 family)